MEKEKKKMIQEQLSTMKVEITTVSRWLINTKKAHSWDKTVEGYMLEALHRTSLLLITIQKSLVQPEKITVQVEE